MTEFTTSGSSNLARFLKGEGEVPLWIQWLAWSFLAAILSKLVFQFGIIAALGVIGIVVALPIGVSFLWRTDLGIYLMLILAFFISIPNRLLENVPMGILLDVIIVLMLVGMLYRSKYYNDWSAFKSPASIAIMLWGGMNLFELVNPVAGSREAWFYVVRPAVGYMMLFFITYHTLNTSAKLFTFIYSILALSIFSSLWGIWQANFGYFTWEYNYVLRHDIIHLVFNYGRWRAIGTIGSPAQFGIIMAFMSVFSLSLFFASKGFWKSLFLLAAAVITLMGMVYSGTRSAFIIIPIFFFVWVILARQKKMYIFLVIGGIIMTFIIITPSNNYHIQRIQSTFKASEDASYQTRARNKKLIFPWILAHPIGGGLGSTGVWGQRFTPGTFLANFPPDSGLIRVAVELGWIGLALFLYVYYRVLVTGTFTFWRMTEPKYKAIVSGIIGGVAALLVVEWGQEVVGVFPMSILFWMFLAIMLRAIYFDQQTTVTNAKDDHI